MRSEMIPNKRWENGGWERRQAGFSLVLESTGYSPVAGHTFLIVGASHSGARALEHRLMVVSQGLSCSHRWDLLKPGSSATLTSCIRTESERYEGDVYYWCLAGIEGDPSQMVTSSVIPFSSCPQSFPASGSFQMSQLFTSGGQSIEASASASVLPMNI